MNKVALLGCDSYEYTKIKSSIQKSFELLGGIDRYIDKGDKVLLKLNLLMKKDPKLGVTTHPIFTKALAEILIDYGAEVIIGDSPGGPFNKSILKGIYKVCGIEEIANETGARLNYNTDAVVVKNDNGLILKSLTIIDVITKVDKVISVSKLKTHGMMLFTGACKNMFGSIAGLEKAEYHVRMPKKQDFADALIDICDHVNPVLSFMDGVIGMEGAGPSAGTPRKVGVVLASDSPHHLDCIATDIVSILREDVPTLKRAIERELCKADNSDIELLGDSIEDFIITDFKLPSISSLDLLEGRVPKFMRNIINNNMQPRPIFVHETCVGCGDCAKYCPPRVIDMVNDKPIVDLKGCIRCFCCQELCPAKAVDIKRPIMMKLLAKM